MKTSELFILIGGALSFMMVIFHCMFYKLFGWKIEFDKIQLANRRIFMTIHIALILLFIMFSFLSFCYYREMAACNGIAFGFVIGYAIFWLWRTVWQMIYFKVPKGIKKTPVMHYVLIIIFGLLFISYSIPIVMKLMN